MHFAAGKIVAAIGVCAGVSNSPPDCCIPMGSTPFPLLKQKTPPLWVALFACERATKSSVGRGKRLKVMQITTHSPDEDHSKRKLPPFPASAVGIPYNKAFSWNELHNATSAHNGFCIA